MRRALAPGLLSALLVVTPVLAQQPAPSPAPAATNTFKPLPAGEPLPGQAASIDDADEKARAALPPPCTGRSRSGAETGTWLGAIAGIVAGIFASDKDDSGLTKAGKAAAGAGIGSTVGYLAGRASDGDRDCPGMNEELPRSPIVPADNEIEWEKTRRERAGGP